MGRHAPHSPWTKNVHFCYYRARRTVLFLLLLETSVFLSEHYKKKFVSIWDESVLKYVIFFSRSVSEFFFKAFFSILDRAVFDG